jgi:hypothetical protein
MMMQRGVVGDLVRQAEVERGEVEVALAQLRRESSEKAAGA